MLCLRIDRQYSAPHTDAMKTPLLSILTAALLFTLAQPAASGPSLGDRDGDGIDDQLDSCRDVRNENQRDTDGDGCGNACDADYDQDGRCDGNDFKIFRLAFGLSEGDPAFNANADHDGDGRVDGTDFDAFQSMFGRAPGPSMRPGRKRRACP